MNTDNDLNLHSMTKLSGWLRYCFVASKFSVVGFFCALDAVSKK